MADTELAGRVALISGGGRGVGRGISEELAAAGATVAVLYHRDADAAKETAETIAASGGTATVHHAAVESFDDCRRACDEVLAAHGGVDILVCNAGIASRGGKVAETEPAEMERLFGIHVMGAFHLAHLLVPQMRARPRGDVVMVSSVNATANPGRGAPYNVAKSGLESLAYTLAREEVRHGTHVNVVAPGLVATEMGRRLVKAAGVEDIHSLDDSFPYGHVCEPADVARVVRFLVSDGGGYVSGQRIVVDGGGAAVSPDTEPVSLYEGLLSTRAVRRYTDEKIPDDALRDILFAATRAPSGSNRQPFRFMALTDGAVAAEAKRLIGVGARQFWDAKRAEDGYDKGSGTDDSSPKSRLARTMQHYVDAYESVPVLVLACYVRYRAHTAQTDGASIYPACQNLLLAARALGYGGVLTGLHHFADAELRQLLRIPDEAQIMATITLGRPQGRHGPVRRRPLHELVFGEQWGQPPDWAVDPDGVRHTAAGPPRPS